MPMFITTENASLRRMTLSSYCSRSGQSLRVNAGCRLEGSESRWGPVAYLDTAQKTGYSGRGQYRLLKSYLDYAPQQRQWRVFCAGSKVPHGYPGAYTEVLEDPLDILSGVRRILVGFGYDEPFLRQSLELRSRRTQLQKPLEKFVRGQ